MIGIWGEIVLCKVVFDYVVENFDLLFLVCNSVDYFIFGEIVVDCYKLDMILFECFILFIVFDYYMGWVNMVVLKVVGIFVGRSLSVGNEIVMGVDGLVFGELCESEVMGFVLELGVSGGCECFGIVIGGNLDFVMLE